MVSLSDWTHEDRAEAIEDLDLIETRLRLLRETPPMPGGDPVKREWIRESLLRHRDRLRGLLDDTEAVA